MIGRLLRTVKLGLTAFLVAAVRCYQLLLRPMLPAMCKFETSCSEYFILSVNKDGPLKGTCKGVWRICRCNPWSRGG